MLTKDRYVFISYSSKDDVQVKQIVRLLDGLGVEWWKAPEMIPAGSSYAREIVHAIEDCGLFLFLFSENSQHSIWCEKEVDCALTCNKQILPYNLDGTLLNDALKFYLNNVQMIFSTPGSDEGINKLTEYLLPLSAKKTGAPPAKVQDPPVHVAASVPRKPLPGQPSVPGQHIVKASAQKPAVSPANRPAAKTAKPAVKKRMIARDLNTLNRTPAACQYCGGMVIKKHEGTYVCDVCGKENYDDFQAIRNYIRANGPASTFELEEQLGIPRRIINDWRDKEGFSLR